MPAPVNDPLALGHLLGVNPPGLARDVRKGFSPGFPVWDVTLFKRNLVIQDTPYFYKPGRGPAVQFQLTHNTLTDAGLTELFTFTDEEENEYVGLPCGKRWWSNLQTCVMAFCNGQSLNSIQIAIVVLPDMRVDAFIGDPHNPTLYRSMTGGNFFKVRRPDEGTFEIEFKDHTVLTYTYRSLHLSNGMPCFQLTKITDAIGQSLTVEWNDDANKLWQFTKVIDALNRETEFIYTDQGGVERLTSITPFSGSGLDTPSFSYDSDRINSITNQAGFSCDIGYWDVTSEDPDVVKTIDMTKQTPEGSVPLHTEFDYDFVDGFAQLKSATDPGNGQRQYAPGTEEDTLVITNERGFTATHQFNLFGGSVKITDTANESTYAVFDLYKRLVRRTIDRELRVADMVFDDGKELVNPSISVEHAPIFNPGTGNFSIVGLFCMKGGETGGTLISHGSAFSVSVSTSQVTVSAGGGTVNLSLPGSAPLNDGYYHGIAITRENGTLRCVLDGVSEDETSATSEADSEDPILIGGFSGRLKAVSFWRAGFTELQTKAMSAGGFDLSSGVQGLVTYWPLDDGENTENKVVDLVGGHDGDISSGTWEGFDGESRGNLLSETRWLELYTEDPDSNPYEPMSGDEKIVNSFEYNENDDLEATIEAEGSDVERRTEYAYEDPNGFIHNVTKITDALSNETVLAYVPSGNGAGKLQQSTQPTGQSPGLITSYVYDSSWDLQTVTAPEGDVKTLTHDALGRLKTVTNALGQVVEYDYDNLHRLTETKFPNTKTIVNEYNEVELIKVTDMATGETKYKRDAMSRLLEVEDQEQRTVLVQTYESNGSGLLETLTDPKGTTTFEYDDLSRLYRRYSPMSMSIYAEFGYDKVGNMTSFKDEDDNNLTYVYDALNRLRGECPKRS